MNAKTWIIFGAASIAILAGLIFLSKQNSLDVSNVDKFKTIISQQDADNVKSGIPDRTNGNKDAKIVLIEYGDYSCPGCTTLEGNIKKVLKDYGKEISVVFRHFPITSIHPNSKIAAAYAEAAGLQGKFWEMHDKLFSNRTDWSGVSADKRDKIFDEYAKQLGLDMDKLKKDISSNKVAQKIAFDQAIGKASGVSGTPSVLLNGRSLKQNEFSNETELRNTIKQAIESTKK